MTTPALRRLPDGFQERGGNVTRLEAFVDAAFAFAVTLLVIALGAMPTSIGAMVEALKGVPAFAASFVQIIMFWSAHATWSRRFGLDDARSRRLSLLLVFLVLVYVYPLKIMFSAFFYWISGGWFPTLTSIETMSDLRMMFIVYGIAFGTLSLCIAALYRQALSATVEPALDANEILQSRQEALTWLYSAIIAGMSITAAIFLPSDAPGWLTGMPGILYCLRAFTTALSRRLVTAKH